jgi:DNA end-binding protein Ku
VEKTYYLVPDKGAEKSYRLLARSMERAGKVAVGKYYARGRDNLVMIEPNNGELVMYQLYYQSEVRAFEYKFSNASEPGVRELELAQKLIRKLCSKGFNPSKYYDQYAERIRTAIDAKVSGDGTVKVAASKPPTEVVDLASLLERSLQKEA